MKIPVLTLTLVFTAAAWAKDPPAPGTTFHLTEDYPKYVTADIEFRDPEGMKWPSFAYGKPDGKGTLVFDPDEPSAEFVLVCDRFAQNSGDQSRRVAGEAIDENGEGLPVRFEVRQLAETRTEDREVTEKNGKTKKREVEVTPADCLLEVGDHEIRVTAQMTYQYPFPDDSFHMTFTFEVDGSDLGFDRHPGPISVTVRCSGFPTKEKPEKD